MVKPETVYAAVTPDQYEFIVAMNDTVHGLADEIGMNVTSVYKHFNGEYNNSNAKKATKRTRFFFRKINIGVNKNATD